MAQWAVMLLRRVEIHKLMCTPRLTWDPWVCAKRDRVQESRKLAVPVMKEQPSAAALMHLRVIGNDAEGHSR